MWPTLGSVLHHQCERIPALAQHEVESFQFVLQVSMGVCRYSYPMKHGGFRQLLEGLPSMFYD